MEDEVNSSIHLHDALLECFIELYLSNQGLRDPAHYPLFSLAAHPNFLKPADHASREILQTELLTNEWCWALRSYHSPQISGLC